MNGDLSARPEIEAALVLLERLGLSVDDLVSGQSSAAMTVPTFSEFILNRTGFVSGYIGWVAASVSRVWLGS